MASGKSTISFEIQSRFPELNYVNSDLVREYFRKSYPYYNDLDESLPTEKCTTLNKIVSPLRIDILKLFIWVQEPILFNKSWLTYESRKAILDMLPSDQYTKILIQTQIDEAELRKRIQERDTTYETSRNWLQFHDEMRAKLYEEVDQWESEYVLIYDQTNLNEIIELIEKYI